VLILVGAVMLYQFVVNKQDRGVQESMGVIVNRSIEHLGPADRAIITGLICAIALGPSFPLL